MSNLASLHLVAPTFLNATKDLLIVDYVNAFFSTMIVLHLRSAFTTIGHSYCTTEKWVVELDSGFCTLNHVLSLRFKMLHVTILAYLKSPNWLILLRLLAP